MKRRNFIKKSTLAAGAIPFATKVNAKTSMDDSTTFKLKYAPHLGMFKNLASEDPIAQLNFMADEGFTAF